MFGEHLLCASKCYGGPVHMTLYSLIFIPSCVYSLTSLLRLRMHGLFICGVLEISKFNNIYC